MNDLTLWIIAIAGSALGLVFAPDGATLIERLALCFCGSTIAVSGVGVVFFGLRLIS